MSLRVAIIVNPYDTDQVAEAIRYALEMKSEERHARVHQMRRSVKENNVYKWAGNRFQNCRKFVSKNRNLRHKYRSGLRFRSAGRRRCLTTITAFYQAESEVYVSRVYGGYPARILLARRKPHPT
jgi:hypothetical protein